MDEGEGEGDTEGILSGSMRGERGVTPSLAPEPPGLCRTARAAEESAAVRSTS